MSGGRLTGSPPRDHRYSVLVTPSPAPQVWVDTLDTVCRQRAHRVEGGVSWLQLGLASASAVPDVVRGGRGRLAAGGHQQVVH